MERWDCTEEELIEKIIETRKISETDNRQWVVDVAKRVEQDDRNIYQQRFGRLYHKLRDEVENTIVALQKSLNTISLFRNHLDKNEIRSLFEDIDNSIIFLSLVKDGYNFTEIEEMLNEDE